ncbi:MAG: hypothetical protein HOH95_07270 [Dehalococcoidia bacterium]|jgi:hypothetical protein|nr:hypothetical protein [Dehalococcoidia bacterium]
MVKRIATVLGMLAALGGMLVVGGCFGSEEEAQTGAFSDLLRFVPDEAAYRERVTITDYAAIREHYGLEARGGEEAWIELAEALQGDDVMVPLMSGILGAARQDFLNAEARWKEGFGFGFGEIDRALMGGYGPPRNIYVVGGRFDAAGVEEALAKCTECQPHEVREHSGQRYLAWGDQWQFHLDLREGLPAFDQFGRGGLFVFSDEHVVRAHWFEDIEWMIDASRGENSLGERAGFGEVATVADELGLFTLVLTDVTQDLAMASKMIGDGSGRRSVVDGWTPDEGEVLLRQYSAWGAGSGVDEEGAFTAVILAHSSEEAAAENVGRLEERLATGSSVWRELAWSELFSRVEVSSDGVVLTAKLYGAGSVEGLLVEGMDPLLLHE